MSIERNFTHIHKGANDAIGPATKSFCGRLFDECKQGGYAYRNWAKATCPDCLAKAERVEKMRSGL